MNLPHGQEIQGSLGVRSLLLRSILRLVRLNGSSVMHHLFNVTQTQRIGHIPAHACEHHFQRVVEPFENFCGNQACVGLSVTLIATEPFIQQRRNLPTMIKSQAHRAEGENISREEALDLLRVKKETLYTYVSRGWIQSFPLREGRRHVFSRTDVLRVRARSLTNAGIGAMAESAMRYGEPIIVSRITEITPNGPRYRGRLAVDLAEQGCAFEAVAHWLWTGVWLDDQISWSNVSNFKPAFLGRKRVRMHSDDFIKSQASVVLECGMGGTGTEQSKLAQTLRAAQEIIQVQVGMLGFLSAKRQFSPVLAGKQLSASVGRILEADAGPETAATLNAMLVLCADYELTPASFAARVVASSGGDLYVSVAAGLCAHSGLLTSQICDKLTYLLSGGTDCRDLDARLDEVNKFGSTIYGFNPVLAPKGDARAYWMIARAKALAREKRLPVTDNIIRFLARVEADFGLYPGLPAGLVTLASALDLPPKSAAAIWGIGRTAGQIAHIIEQRITGFILRPRAMYVAA